MTSFRRKAAGIVFLPFTVLVEESRAQWTFTDVTASAGVQVTHTLDVANTPARRTLGGAACGDFDNDGWPDLYVTGGNLAENVLFRNNGDGTFSDVTATSGIPMGGSLVMGATFADWTGDGWLDLCLGGIEATNRKLFRNNGDGTFSDVTITSGVWITTDTCGATFGDLDGDDDLDLLLPHWRIAVDVGHIWLNDGTGYFTEADSAVGYFLSERTDTTDYSFAYNVADLNSDGWMDILCAADFRESHVYLNDGDGTFTNVTDTLVVNDDNGMGTTVADYDRDGDLDWFVTSIYDNTPSHDGNRLYRNDGGPGLFADVTDEAGVRDGLWGWAATLQDFNNDGWLDIYHSNGWPTSLWQLDAARHFISNGDGTFTESAAALGTDHVGQGRGVCAFDYDLDGDIDLFLSNLNESTVLYRNDGGNAGNWLQVKLVGPSPNTEQVGARVYTTSAGGQQMWEMHCGNNFVSQNPVEAHFGLASDPLVDELRIHWTDGSITVLPDVPVNQRLVVSHMAATAAPTAATAERGITHAQAFPNPARDGTRIRFRTAERTHVSVRILDVAGRLARSLHDAEVHDGERVLYWDGLDAQGRRAAAGVYHAEITTKSGRARTKLVLLP